MDTLLAQFANYGFPMVVAAYLLVRVEKKLDDLTTAITELQQAIKVLP
ncbi:YvrJ family protein [Bacillota bacterium LX-D]|nr:YvrJ family protein [Bacillota bacterium LX-D]